jgi:hypothetical protein
MKKLIVFLFSIVLLGSCNKEEWHEERLVHFYINDDISFRSDGALSQVNCTVEYKIISDPNTDTSTVNIIDVTYQEAPSQGINPFYSTEYKPLNMAHTLMNYDHLEFKVTTTCSTNKPINLEFNFEAHTGFKNRMPSDHSTETLLTINNPDTTIYFTWSPPNFN